MSVGRQSCLLHLIKARILSKRMKKHSITKQLFRLTLIQKETSGLRLKKVKFCKLMVNQARLRPKSTLAKSVEQTGLLLHQLLTKFMFRLQQAQGKLEYFTGMLRTRVRFQLSIFRVMQTICCILRQTRSLMKRIVIFLIQENQSRNILICNTASLRQSQDLENLALVH